MPVSKKRKVYNKKHLVFPTCGNKNCNHPASVVKYNKNGYPKFRHECSHCHMASYNKHPYRLGVIPVKKNYCENHDGRLGFPCLCSASGEKVPLPSETLDVDHIDADKYNNSFENLQTLCKMCHAQKTKANGDNGRKSDDAYVQIVTTVDTFFDFEADN